MLPTEPLVAKICVDTAEKGPRTGLKTGTSSKGPMGISDRLGKSSLHFAYPEARILLIRAFAARGLLEITENAFLMERKSKVLISPFS